MQLFVPHLFLPQGSDLWILSDSGSWIFCQETEREDERT